MALVATLVGFGFLTGRRAGDKEAADEDFCLVCLAMQQFARDDGQNTLTEGVLGRQAWPSNQADGLIAAS